MAIRADSPLGRFIGALAYRPAARARGIPRDSPVSRFISAFAGALDAGRPEAAENPRNGTADPQRASAGQAGTGPRVPRAGEPSRRKVLIVEAEPGAAAFALPLAQSMANLAAADDKKGTAILTVRLPDGQTELVLHRQGPADYMLEITGSGGSDIPDILRLRYGLSGEGEQVLLIPVSGGIGLARLPGYATGRPWTAELPVPASEVSGWDPAITVMSVRAAVGGRTKNAWRRVGSLVPAVRDVLDADEERPG